MNTPGSGRGLSSRALGAYLGAEEHKLTEAEIPGHVHDAAGLSTSTAGGHSHTSGTLEASSAGDHTHGSVVTSGGIRGSSASSAGQFNTNGTTGSAGAHSHTITGSTDAVAGHTHPITGATASAGGGAAHNNIPPTAYLNAMVKL